MPRPFARLRSLNAVWLLNAAIAVAAGLLYGVHAWQLGPVAHPHLPLWALVIAFVAGERWVAQLNFSRSAHSCSFGDAPLVLGLLFASTPQLLFAVTGRPGVPLGLYRRIPPSKTVF